MMKNTLFDISEFKPSKKTSILSKEIQDWGTFKDCLRAPVHNWFAYPAGFSYKAVQSSLADANLKPGESTVFDPFMGSGTTNLTAKTLGYHSIGVEAHPFVYRIAKTKLTWDIGLCDLNSIMLDLETILQKKQKKFCLEKIQKILTDIFPELILKCFLPETLMELMIIRDEIQKNTIPENIFEFLRTALICTLRDVSIAATGWPYIAPKKIKITSMSKDGWSTYKKRVFRMYDELQEIACQASSVKSRHRLYLGDSRDMTDSIKNESADILFTSPPYLNNFDYADRTRLELYFMGEAENWNDITEKIRTKLITSATTQINRKDEKYRFLDSFAQECPKEYKILAKAVDSLSEKRKVKGGKKSYDLMTVGYFNDMYQILKESYRILRPDSSAYYILGDSAPYGVHVPTDELIGRIGVDIGFQSYKIRLLRERGGKWEKNPQRHDVPLRETVVILKKK